MAWAKLSKVNTAENGARIFVDHCVMGCGQKQKSCSRNIAMKHRKNKQTRKLGQLDLSHYVYYRDRLDVG